jgi:hypothetical protein
MRRFRCLFVNERDCVESVEPIELEDKAQAVRRAKSMLQWRSTSASAEIRESGRLVARATRSRKRT